jgi:putative nucleotidyltransferase with HDIG domain
MSRNAISAARVVVTYTFLAALWIFFSDSVLERMTQNEILITRIQTYKGFFFVVVTGIVLFLMIMRELRLRDQTWVDHEREKTDLLGKLESSNKDLVHAYDATIEGWAKALELRNREVKNHSARTTEIALRLAKAFQFTEEQITHIRRGALLHDIGKMAIPDHILLKNGPLDAGERETIEKHVRFGIEMVSSIQFLEPALDVLCYHHEKWDGKGYPFKLRGDQIPLSARIFAVADVWDALTSDRPYRPALSRDKALDIIISLAGKHFDPDVIDMFLKLGIPDLTSYDIESTAFL